MTKILIAYELLEEGISKSYIAKHLGVSQRTIIRWAQAIEKQGGLDAFLEEQDLLVPRSIFINLANAPVA